MNFRARYARPGGPAKTGSCRTNTRLGRQVVRRLDLLPPRVVHRVEEIAHVLDVSKRTVDGDWSVVRMWLVRGP